ncbi:ABC transporter permease [Gorillibacterium sp. CAU 1737]|uniref:ABC transporter permease n=1 Tax=Gorillibacterium sp. CAU 1737 TaxID=3140362 RepID=UPI0032601C9F
MPVFKLCLKIIKKNLVSISLYIGIFLLIAALISLSGTAEQASGFSASKAKIAFMAEESTPLVEGFRQVLEEQATLVELPDDKEKLQDALFFRDVTYVVRIPSGFTKDFLENRGTRLEKTTVPGTTDNAYVDLRVQQYWKLANLHLAGNLGITQEALAEQLKQDMAANTTVNMAQFQNKKDFSQSFAANYFNYTAYSLTSVLILGISAIMMVFHNKDLRRRNFCSPIPAGSFTMQLFLANLVYTIAAWAVIAAACFALSPQEILTGNMPYLLVNSIVFTFCMSCLSFLIGNLVTSRNALSAIANVVGLGPSFISGVFVPQQFLGDTVLRIASFTPTYWFVQGNTRISTLTSFNWTSLSPVFYDMLIQIGFAAAFLSAALMLGKRKQLQA